MHPPAFNPTQRLSDWPECWLEVRCPCSPRVAMLPVRLLLERGDCPLGHVLAALCCSTCKGKPAPVYLVAGQARTFTGGAAANWAVELVPGTRRT